MKRTNVVKLIADKNTHEKLKELAILTAKCWNEVNWLRVQQFKKGERVDFVKTEKEVYKKYKQVLKVNAQQVARKNAEDWGSFFSLIHEKRDGKLPRWLKPRPPGYWKGKDGEYKLIIIIRSDRYEVDENMRIIYLKDFKLALKFKGRLKWRGKQGRLEVHYDEARRAWYVHMPVEVEATGVNEDGLSAGVDLGTWLLFKGGGVLAQYEYYGKRISRVQRVLARHGQVRSRRLRLLHEGKGLVRNHALNSMVRLIMRIMKAKGVTRLKVGNPRGINRSHGNKLTANFWNYSYVIRRFKEVGEEYGIRVIEVNESYTSKTCTLCGEAHENGRIHRGLFKCPRMGKVINADLNAAINILHTPKSQGSGNPVRDRGNGPKAKPVVYHWTSRAGWLSPTSNEAMRMKTVNHKPMNHPKG
ncbi:RNA-guided endonuclease InsQ/TnpB family protein, partial [Caldivirga sp.]|uniref:RNA-guided endonuclease InsQ/TnpB family protein n=1 Tax=Caldivirga sp. TaxID=2080243 RepID=UPI003D0DE4D2